MRIAYLCYWNASGSDGVAAKIAGQLQAWRARGHEARLFCLSRQAPDWERFGEQPATFPFSGARGRAAATVRLSRAVTRSRPDGVYVRHDLFLPPPVALLRRFASALEINTDDRAELRLRRMRAQAYGAASRRAMLDSAGGVVCVTRELARLHGDGRPHTVIANGVRFEDAPPAAPAPRARPRLVFLAGSPDPWQGVDKVLALATAAPEWDVVVVGGSPAVPGRLPANVMVLPRMPREAYGAVLADSDVAIGTLALHRKGLDEACPLKVRESLAHGLPTIIGYEDTDFAGRQPWYVLRLPNTERNVADGLGAIRAFVERVRGRRVAREEVEPIIGLDAKEDARLTFLQSLVEAHG